MDDKFAARATIAAKIAATIAFGALVLAPASACARCLGALGTLGPRGLVAGRSDRSHCARPAHAAPRDLRPVARRRARQFVDRKRPRPHSLRFRRQCLPGLFAGIPPGLRARHRRGQDLDQRSALDHLGRRRRQEVQIHIGELRRRKSRRSGRRSCRARSGQDRRGAGKARAKDPRSRSRRRVPDRAYGARDRCRACRQEHSQFPGL